MNDIFSPRRFGKYLQYDLVNARNNYGLSLLVSCCTPLMFYFVYQLFSLTLGNGWGDYHVGMQIAAFFVSWLIVSFFAPSKLYGKLTEKRAGTDWILIPASPLEKTLSMFIVTCVVVPAVALAAFCACDGLLSLVAPGYGPFIFGRNNLDLYDKATGMIGLWITPASFYISFCCNILFFALGAIIFKKSKVAKTILASFALSILLSSAISAITGTLSIDTESLMRLIDVDSAEALQKSVNLFLNIYYLLFFAAVDLAIYFRIKTIKH